MFVKQISCAIKKNAQTTIPVIVPGYEIPIIEKIFGEANIYESQDSEPIEVEAESEFSRLIAKYGQDPVYKVFGESGTIFKDHLQKFEVKKPKIEKPEAEKV